MRSHLSAHITALVFALKAVASLEVELITKAPAPSPIAERQLISNIEFAPCSTVSGIATPQPSGTVCNFQATSDGTGFLVVYTTGANIASVGACGQICLATAGCTNFYFTLNAFCNLHFGVAKPMANGNTAYRFYEVGCFICPKVTSSSTSKSSATSTASSSATSTSKPPVCSLVSPQPLGNLCGIGATSDGTKAIINYTTGDPITSIAACGAACLANPSCTNVYFAVGAYCNLKSGTPTAILNGNTDYRFYNATCFRCGSCSTRPVSLAVPVPPGVSCGMSASSWNNTGFVFEYSSGIQISSLVGCGAACLGTPGCTNLYYAPNAFCNLRSGAPIPMANGNTNYQFYDAACFSCPSASTSSSSLSRSSSIVTSRLTTTQPPWLSIETNPSKYNMAITTAYTQPPQCKGELISQMAWRGTNLWENAINPVPTLTITTCYPSQFYSSVMGAINSVVLPHFSALICPDSWVAWNYNSTYLVCCPKGFGISAPNYTLNKNRPFSAAACTSTLVPEQLYDITSYGPTGYLSIVPATAGPQGTVVRVNAFDGIAATIIVSSSTTKTP